MIKAVTALDKTLVEIVLAYREGRATLKEANRAIEKAMAERQGYYGRFKTKS